MSQEQRKGQGTVIPTMFVGLGGTGSRIVDRIAARAMHLPNWESQLRPLTHFLSIDTNELDQNKLHYIPEGNRLNISAFDKSKVIEHFRRSKDRQALQWLDKAYQPRPGVKPGAGQIRVESRLGFFYHSPDIRQRLHDLIHESLRPGITWRQKSPPKYYVYVFCTLAGGTGSGSFLLLAYLLDEIIRKQDWHPRIIGNLLLSTLMTDKVGPELHPDIHANTYAALKEVEHLTKLDYPQIKQQGRTSEEFSYYRDENHRKIRMVKTRPFFLSFLFDRPPHLSLSHVERAIGDCCYLQVFTPIIDNLAGELDNYEKRMEDLTHFPGDLKNVGEGYTKNFGAFGAVALSLPGEDLLEYSALRFAAQAIRSQITFGVDSTDATDDRARALARLAVDYSDPKFLNMSDEAREEVIHKAFVRSVQEMARQDEVQELKDGYWYRLRESIDEGRVTGIGDDGEPVRGESRIDEVARHLEDERQGLIHKISIRERSFIFHKETVNQYIDHVSQLMEEFRQARQLVDEGIEGLQRSAREGEAVSALQLDPIAERYLVLRLLNRCDREWIPEAEKTLKNARKQDVSNPKVRERLEKELFESLREAANTRRIFGKDHFLDVRDEAQEYYRGVTRAARKSFAAEIALEQTRALAEYLRRRARQYAHLASRMDSLVHDLERDAERLRRGETAVTPPYDLRVEVFETLDEPPQRLWDRVYRRLFVDDGKLLTTFDRELLARAISQELKPVVGGDGRVQEKTVSQTVTDLRRTLVELGRRQLRPTLLGGDGRPGLDLARGLELEARLVLEPARREGEEVTEEEIEAYRDQKFRALAQMAGVLARIRSDESKALDDGVTVNRTRQLILHIPGGGGGRAAEGFVRRLESILSTENRQVKMDDSWTDPHLAIVHDVEMPIPLYYFQPVVEEIEDAYLRLAADESRSYHLHIDYQWEQSLPNLNPRRSELTVGWSLQALADGLITEVLGHDAESDRWVWHRGQGKVMELGEHLAAVLYRIGEIHREPDLQSLLESQLRERAEDLDAEAVAHRREELLEQTRSLLGDMGQAKTEGRLGREQALDRPVLRALLQTFESGESFSSLPRKTGKPRRTILGVTR